MRNRLLVACLSLSLAACGGTEATGPASDGSTSTTGSTGDIRSALAALPSAEVLGAHEDGVPFMIRGNLGSASGPVMGLAAREAHERVGPALAAIAPVFRLRAADLVVQRLSRDEQGHTHLRYAQTRNGLPVFGHEFVLHMDASGRVYAANGSARDGESVPAPSRAKVSPVAVKRAALESTPGGVRVEGEPRLLYVRSTKDQRLKLAFEVVVTGESHGGPVREHVFLDALDGTPVQRFSDIHEALNRIVYTAGGSMTLPGTVVRPEGAPPTGDAVADTAYDNLGLFYNCYKTLFNRDSYDNAGAQLKLSVHFGNNYVSAFWNGTQMACGDGDGNTASPLCSDLDVVVHEFAHAVTSFESNLVYSGESGGLSESLSDISAAFCESWTTGTWSAGPDIWKIAEGIWTPANSSDALRYMDDPAKDGVSLDHYSAYTSNTSVHYSSGIGNLAFALLSKGGTHPRGKSTVNVTAVGVEKAARIFYKANTDLFTGLTTFAQARTYTEQAAELLYGTGSAVKTSVTQAWQAVGVGGAAVCPPLANGTALTGLSGAASDMSCAYTIAVPVGATNLKVETSGGTGDVDLYVKYGSAPTTAAYDCRPYLGGNTEACTFPTPSTGTYHVVLRGFSAYSGVSLKASFTPPSGAHLFPNLSGAANSQQFFTYNAAAGQTVSVTLSPNAAGSTGDADLHVRFGSAPTTTAYDCRPYQTGNTERCTLTQPTAGTYYLMVRGYSAYTGVDLTVSVP